MHPNDDGIYKISIFFFSIMGNMLKYAVKIVKEGEMLPNIHYLE